ncbi:hypothetical protein TEGAF0_13730 [Sediminibacterium sp. TEGAF015]|nr:hypothetical protein TEGAF0_13730 [Sediminibacterium sp. TEGAF015]
MAFKFAGAQVFEHSIVAIDLICQLNVKKN